MKKINNFIKLFIILIAIFGVGKINVLKDVGTVYNDNSNKVLDLTAMAIKIEEIRQNDLYNKIIELLNLKKLDDEIIEELNRDLITKYIDRIIIYEEEKVDVILKYERKIKEM